MKIVSLVPSLTELLFDLNLDDQIVGVTRFCIHPFQKTKRIRKIGGTKTVKTERVLALNPDLVIANKEENSKSDIEELQKHCNVWVTDIYTLADALQVINDLGIRANCQSKANQLINDIKINFQLLKSQISDSKKTFAYLIWQDPIMLAGRDTFINEMAKEIGLTNIVLDEKSRYPEQTQESLSKLKPDYMFLSSEPFPFQQKHLKTYVELFPNSKVLLVDGEMFSWYGSRMKLAPKYFERLINELQ
jgi:ABC-type Fe3+-hydroxamate transport system substrate-binding protein